MATYTIGTGGTYSNLHAVVAGESLSAGDIIECYDAAVIRYVVSHIELSS